MKRFFFFILRLLSIQSTDSSKLLVFGGIYFLISAATGIVYNSVDGQFGEIFSEADAKAIQPTFLILSSLVTIIASFIYTNYADRLPKSWFFTILIIVSASLFSFFGVILIFYPKSIIIVELLYILKFVIPIFLYIIFWEIANIYFEFREGKRLFPNITMIGATGYSIGAFGLAFLSHYFSKPVSIIVSGAVFATVVFFYSNYPPSAWFRQSAM